MASIKSFITISMLSLVHKDDLVAFLLPIKDTLVERGIWKEDEKTDFDYRQLARYLHEKCPEEIENKLYAFHSIAKPEWIEEIEAALSQLKIETEILDDVYKKAALLVNTDIDLCNKIAAKHMADEPHTYLHYKPTSFRSVDPLTTRQLVKLNSNLSSFFAKAGKSDHIAIYPHTIGDYVFYCVSHGAPKTRENSVGEEQKVHTFRPELVDIVRVNLTNGEISIHMKRSTSKAQIDTYIKAFGNTLLPDSIYVENHKYNTNALRNPNALSIGEMANDIARVEVAAFTYLDRNGCKKICSQNISAELFECMEADAHFVAITFNFQFTPHGGKFKARISGGNKSESPTGVNETLIEKFFVQNGFIVEIDDAETFEMLSTGTLSAVR
jgi:hypothetical protein